jgi:hypothetical protein
MFRLRCEFRLGQLDRPHISFCGFCDAESAVLGNSWRHWHGAGRNGPEQGLKPLVGWSERHE